jgi:FO synthase
VQEVIVQNFLPKPGTAMWKHEPCDRDEFLWTIAAARLVLGPDAHVQAPPNLSRPDELGALVAAGIDDWGGVSPVTPDHVNPERPWPALDALRDATEAAGKTLAPRLTVYPEYVRGPDQWLDPAVRFAVLCASDSEGLARDDDWAAGGDAAPPELVPADPASHVAPPALRAHRPARSSPACSPARRWASTRS